VIERLRDFKIISLRYTVKDFEAVKEGKKEGESWETYILRLTVKGGK
jgi:hypothetical protein